MTRLSRVIVKDRVREAVDDAIQSHLDMYGLPDSEAEMETLADSITDELYGLLGELDDEDMMNVPSTAEHEENGEARAGGA